MRHLLQDVDLALELFGAIVGGGGGGARRGAIDAHHHRGDVVVSATGVGEIDESLRRLRDVFLRQQIDGLGVVQVGVQAIRAQQELVTGQDFEIDGVALYVLVDAHRARHRVLVGLVGGVLDAVLGDLAAPDELVDQRVVLRELHHLAAPHQVDAAVTHVRDEAAIARDQQGGGGGAHAALVRLRLPAGVDGMARRLDGLLQDGEDLLWPHGGVALGEALDDVAIRVHRFAKFVDGDVGRHLTTGVPAHAISDDEQRQLLIDQEVVFVGLALSSDVGGGPEAQLHRQGVPLVSQTRNPWLLPRTVPHR